MNCADCTATTTAWVALPHGIVLCDACAETHRSLKVSQVRAIDVCDVSKSQQAASMYRAKPGAPSRLDKTATNVQRFNQAKALYKDKRWFVGELPPPVSTDVMSQEIDFFGEYGL